MEIFKVFKFDAAHYLPCVPEGHKCSRMHGHSFRIEIHLRGAPDPQAGWVMDFADISAICQPVIDSLDHKCLNHIEGLANPTSENLARWLWLRLKPSLPLLNKVVVQESPESGCIFRGKE